MWIFGMAPSGGGKGKPAVIAQGGLLGEKMPVPCGMPGEAKEREGGDDPGPAKRVDGCRVRPGFLYTVGGSRLSRLAGGQLPVPICHQGSLGACFMALHTLQAAALCARVALSLTRRSPI